MSFRFTEITINKKTCIEIMLKLCIKTEVKLMKIETNMKETFILSFGSKSEHEIYQGLYVNKLCGSLTMIAFSIFFNFWKE